MKANQHLAKKKQRLKQILCYHAVAFLQVLRDPVDHSSEHDKEAKVQHALRTFERSEQQLMQREIQKCFSSIS